MHHQHKEPLLKVNSAIKLTALATILSVLLAITIAAIFLGSYSADIQNYMAKFIPNTPWGALAFILLLTPAMAMGLPRQIAAISAGFLFGAGLGMAIATTSAIVACILTLIVARQCFANLVQRHYPLPLAKVTNFFSHNTFLKALIIRLLPAGSNFLTNVLAGTARTPVTPYVFGSALGFIPQMTIFSLMGAGLQVNGQQQLILSGVLLVIAVSLSGYLYRKTRIQFNLQSLDNKKEA